MPLISARIVEELKEALDKGAYYNEDRASQAEKVEMAADKERYLRHFDSMLVAGHFTVVEDRPTTEPNVVAEKQFKREKIFLDDCKFFRCVFNNCEFIGDVTKDMFRYCYFIGSAPTNWYSLSEFTRFEGNQVEESERVNITIRVSKDYEDDGIIVFMPRTITPEISGWLMKCPTPALYWFRGGLTALQDTSLTVPPGGLHGGPTKEEIS